MPKLKPPLKKDNENKEPKYQLSIVTELEKSAKADLERLGEVVSGLGQPIAAMMASDEFAASTRIISDIINSPGLQMASQALAETQKVATTLAEPMFRLDEARKSILEPMQRLQESVVALNKQYSFDISPNVLSLLNTPALDSSPINWDRIIYSPKPYSPPKSFAVVVRESMEVLATELISQIDQKFEERFDKFIEKGKIPVGIKNANCNCGKCGHLLMRITDISHFISGTMKCSNCKETLQIPRDLKFESPKSQN